MSFELITLSAFAFSLINTAITRKIGNRKRLEEIRKEISKYQKESTEALKNKDEKKLKEMETKQEELLKMMNEMLILQFKPLLIVLPIFFITSSIIRSTFPTFSITLPLYLPVPVGLTIVWRNVFGPFGWFIICILLASIVIETATSLLKKR